MASFTPSQACRFCGSHIDVIVDLKETRLYLKLLKYFPLKFNTNDLLPKHACTECASTIQQMEGFVLRAREVEQEFLERLPSSSHVIPPAAAAAARPPVDKDAKPTTESVKEALRKLSSKSIVIKKVDKAPAHPLEPMVQINIPVKRSVRKMKMEVLDEAVEHLPADDFVQYNDTDDEDGDSLAERSLRKIESVNIKQPPAGDDYDSDAFEEERLEDDSDTEYVPKEPQVKSSQKGRPKIKRSVVLTITDPCHYVCVMCKAKFRSFEELQTHIEESIPCKKSSLTCEHCGKICDNRRSLYQHRQTHNPKPQLVCDQCGKVYTNSFNLENHKSQVHGAEVEELGYVYKCCEQTFPTRKELNNHIANHSKDLSLLCDTCGKSFTSNKSLRSHAMSHLNIKPYSCKLCDKSFRTKLLLVQHEHVHTGIKLFNCDVCEKSFAKKSSLRSHYKLHSSEPVTWSCTGEKISVKSIEQLQDPEGQPQQEQNVTAFMQYAELTGAPKRIDLPMPVPTP